MFHVFQLKDIRNRAYVVDNHGNKIFFGTLYQCKKFIEYMREGETDGTSIHRSGIGNS